MIKCPKCSFEQPEDIYCANCGVNMKTYRATPDPIWKSFLSSWIGKIAILTLFIIGAVAYDYQRRGQKPEPQQVISQNAQYTRTAEAAADTAPPAPEPEASESVSRFSARNSVSNAATVSAAAMAAPAAAPAASAVPATKSARPILKVTFFEASRAAVQELQRDSQAASSSGDVTGGVTQAKRVQTLVNAGELKSLASNRYQDYDPQNPVVIFKGQRSPDPNKNLGLYFQITPLRQEGGSLQMEVKSWGNVRLQDPDDTLFSSEMTLVPQSTAFVAGFLPKDTKAFNDEEKAFLESDAILKIYNDEAFIDGSSDLIMIIEMATTP